MNRMPARQVWLFQLGCWVAFLVAVLHIGVHVLGREDLSPHVVAGLAMLSPAYVIRVPGLLQPSFTSVVDALSLSYALLFATIGAAGLAVVSYGQNDARLIRAVARAFALGTGMALVVSVLLAFGLGTFVVAIVAMCFALASVPET